MKPNLPAILTELEGLSKKLNLPDSDIELMRIDVLVDEFEKTGKWKNHASVDSILKCAQAWIEANNSLPLLIEALRGHIEFKKEAIEVLRNCDTGGLSYSEASECLKSLLHDHGLTDTEGK